MLRCSRCSEQKYEKGDKAHLQGSGGTAQVKVPAFTTLSLDPTPAADALISLYKVERVGVTCDRDDDPMKVRGAVSFPERQAQMELEGFLY